MHKLLLLLALLCFHFLACSPDRDVFEPGTFESIFKEPEVIIIPQDIDYPVEGIHRMRKLDEPEFVFSDLNKMFLFNRDNMSIKKFGDIGRGPGEYLRPGVITVTDDGQIAFSDALAPMISILDREGGFIRQYNIPFVSPVTRFVFYDDQIYLHGTLNINIIKYNKTDETYIDLFPSDEDYLNLNRGFEGGGICRIDDTIYWINSFEPWIYKYRTGDDSFTRILPDAWKEFSVNHDRMLARNITGVRFAEVSDRIAKFNYFDLVSINNSPHFVISFQRGDDKIVHIMDTDGNLIAEYYHDGWFAGASESELYFSEHKATNGDFEVVLKVYSVR